MSEREAVVARLNLAAARLKAIQDEAHDVVAGLELPAFDDVKVTRRTPPKLPPRRDREDPLERLARARAALAEAGQELVAAHERLTAAEQGLVRLLHH